MEDTSNSYVTTHRPGWKNPKHAQQWENTLKTSVYSEADARKMFAMCQQVTSNVFAALHLDGKVVDIHTSSRIIDFYKTET